MDQIKDTCFYNSEIKPGFQFITGKAWQNLSIQEQDEYINHAFGYWRKRGFPYRSYSKEEIARDFMNLENMDSKRIFLPNEELASHTTGLALANYFHPQIWSVEFARHRSPLQCFNDDELLKSVLETSIKIMA